jgi:UDP-glucose:(heptosyl)LPS alpha-1,3-glucosyltransferase
LLRRLNLDVIHDTGAGTYCDLFQPHGGSPMAVFEQKLLLAPAWLRPWKRAAQGVLPRYRQFAALSRRQFAADGRLVVALSRRVAADFQRWHQVPPERIRLVYNGVDTVRFAPENRDRWRNKLRQDLGVNQRTVLFLVVAHNYRLKGVPQLLAAAGRLAALGRPVHLLVVGGRHAATGRAMAAGPRASSPVTFTGPVDDTAPYYAAADVYVQPTFYDPCSLVALEALAAGLPVVTSQFNGVAELITEGVEGCILADPADVDGLTTRLHAMLDATLRYRMGEAARRLALQHSFSYNCEQLEAICGELAGRRRRAA